MNSLSFTDNERQRFEHQLHSARNVELYRRTLALLELARGRPIVEVARWLRVSRASIYNWVDRYRQAEIPEALDNRAGRGRRRDWTIECEAVLRQALSQSPRACGFAADRWTIDRLREFLARTAQHSLSASTIRRRLRDLGYMWQNSGYVLKPPQVRTNRSLLYFPP